MKLGQVKIISMAMLLLGLAIGVFGAFALEEGSSFYNFSVVLLCVLFVAALIIIGVFARCPNCGRHLFYQFYKIKRCPKCGKPLDASKKYEAPDKQLRKLR